MVVVVITVWRCRLVVGLALMVLMIDGVFPCGDSGVGCCAYTDYGAFYGGYGCFVGLWLAEFSIREYGLWFYTCFLAFIDLPSLYALAPYAM